MCEISVVMPVYNSAAYVSHAIESVLIQSFGDFELIIVDDGSTDNTSALIGACSDKRIKLLHNKHDFISSLNRGMNAARGKYIARMDADDLMHVDRLKIQHSIMNEHPEITVCGTWATIFGDASQEKNLMGTAKGMIDLPLLNLLPGNFIFHPTAMLRADFYKQQGLQYEHYPYAEDYKLWVEIAKLGGKFYVERQPLLYYRVSDSQVSTVHKTEQGKTTERIKAEIMTYLIEKNAVGYPELTDIHAAFCKLKDKGLITENEASTFLQLIFLKNREKLSI